MIEQYRFGSIVIDGTTYWHDVIVLPGRVEQWRREEGHAVCEADVAAAVAAQPGVMVIGTGMVGRMRVPPPVMDFLAAKGIVALVERTGTAWRLFNEYAAAGDAVVGLFHLTC